MKENHKKQSQGRSLLSLFGSFMVQGVKKKITWYIVTMVIENYMSLSTVEDQIFKTLLSRHEL
jgi:hypothetical protein